MKSCGDCKHYKSRGFRNWGDCDADFKAPAWMFCEETPINIVWLIPGHPQNYAETCEMFEPKEGNL